MKFDNINENLDKLLHSKKIMLLIPGVIVVAIALVLLVFAVLGVTPENGKQEQALIETRDTIMSELIQAREYLSQLEGTIADNWKVLKQDNFAADISEMTLLSQYESLKQKLFIINDELYGYIENNENLNEETKRILLAIVSSLISTRDEMEISYNEFLKKLESINNSHQEDNLDIRNWLFSLNQETTDINNNLSKSMNDLKIFIDLMNLQQQISQSEDMEIIIQWFDNMVNIASDDRELIIQWFSEMVNIADGDREVINQWFNDIINIADGDREVINQWFNEMINIADGDREVINQWFNDIINIADGDREVINKWFNEMINIADGDREVINQWFTDMINIADGDREVINQWFADMINIADGDREVINQWFSEMINIADGDREVINQWFNDIINIADGDREMINQWFNEMINIADGDREVINQWFSEMVNIADGDREVINQWFNEMINIADGDRDMINQWFNEMINIADGDRDRINQWFINMANIANDDREAIISWFNELTKLIKAEMGELTKGLEVESIKLQGLFSDKVAGLTNDLGSLKQQIEITQNTICDLLGMMSLEQNDWQLEIMKSFDIVNNNIISIKNEYAKTHDKIISIYQEIKETASGQHDELLDVLGKMANQMDGDNKNTMQSLISTMEQLNQLNEESIEIMNILNLNHEKLDIMNVMNQESFTRLGDTIDERIGRLNNTIVEFNNKTDSTTTNISNQLLQQEGYLGGRLNDIDGQFSDIQTLLDSRFRSMETRIGEVEGSLNVTLNNRLNPLIYELQKVFQQVANGKELLAATLAAKGRPVAFDIHKKYPDFDDINEAIKALETTILINEMPGNIVYTLHFHTTINGGDTTIENEFSLNKLERDVDFAGGCFHIPRTHEHTGNTTFGGGCHGQRNQHNHSTACNRNCPGESRLRYNSTCNGSSVNMSRERRNHTCGSLNNVYTWDNPCGGSTGHCKTAARGTWGAWGSDNCVFVGCGLNTNVSWSLNCGKTESTIEAMLLGCGYVWKQIVKATITW